MNAKDNNSNDCRDISYTINILWNDYFGEKIPNKPTDTVFMVARVVSIGGHVFVTPIHRVVVMVHCIMIHYVMVH